jgi:hypothetical protein
MHLMDTLMPCPAPQPAASMFGRDACRRGLSLLAVALGMGSILAACSGEEPLTEPEGGMHAFAVTYSAAVSDGNPGPLYQTISDANHERLARALVELRDMETLLQRLQPSERDVYREQAGLPFAATLETPADLLAHLLSRAQLPTGERVIRGLAVDQVQPTDDPNVVTVVTIADETYTLHRGEDSIWRVHAPVDAWIERSLADLQQSQTNLAGIVDMFGSGTDELDELRRLGFLAPEEGEADP